MATTGVNAKEPASGPLLEPGVIYIDSRVGSRELAPLLQRNHGRKIALVTLNSADVAFRCGHAEPSAFCEGDYGCSIAVERKTLSDLIGSLLKNRLAGRQIPLMLRDYTLSFVLIEGRWRPALDDAIEQVVWSTKKDNGIEILKWAPVRGPLTYSQLAKWLNRYDALAKGKLVRWRTTDMAESAAFIASLHGWWAKEWKHHSMGAAEKMPQPDRALLRMLNEKEKMLASFPGVGFKSLSAVARRFKSVFAAVTASPRQWEEAGLKRKIAYDLYTVLRKETW